VRSENEWGWSVPFSRLWRFVSGSYSKIRDSSPLMNTFQERTVIFNLLQNIETLVPSVVLLISRPIFRNRFRADFSRLQIIGQNLMNGVVWVNPDCSPIVLTVNQRWSDRTGSRTLFSSFFAVEGLPLRGSSSIDSLPSEYARNQLKTWALERTLSPYACWSFRRNVSKSEAKTDSTPLLEILVPHFQKALKKKKTDLRKQSLWTDT